MMVILILLDLLFFNIMVLLGLLKDYKDKRIEKEEKIIRKKDDDIIIIQLQ